MFDLDNQGFERQWWDRRLDAATRHNAEFYRWTLFDQEVARAHVSLDSEIGGEYIGIGTMPELAHDITFFEVHSRFRLQGIGSGAIDELEGRFPDRILTAFSKRAGGFWASRGGSISPESMAKCTMRHYSSGCRCDSP